MRLCPDRLESRQPSGVERSDHFESPGCGPIGFQQSQEIDPLPQRRTRDGKQPREAIPPCRKVRHEPQQHIHQQGRVNLPSHRVGAVTEETAELEALLDLFKEHLDVPAAAIEIAHGARTLGRVVGDEDPDPPRSIHFHPGLDPPQIHPLVPALQGDGLILEDVLIIRGMIFHRPVFHVVLGVECPRKLIHFL